MKQSQKTLATKEDIASLRTKIANAKVDTIKWIFVFFVALMMAIIGLYLK